MNVKCYFSDVSFKKKFHKNTTYQQFFVCLQIGLTIECYYAGIDEFWGIR